MRHEEFVHALKKYLRGTLSEGEKEQFEAHYPECELCEHDIHQAIAEHEMVDRYVLGNLTGNVAEFFEKHYFLCNSCFAEVQETEQLIAGLSYAEEQGVLTVDKKKSAKTWLADLRDRFKSILLTPAFALAALLILLVYPALRGFFDIPKLQEEIANLKQPQANARLYHLEPGRDIQRDISPEQTQRIEIPATGAGIPIILQFMPEHFSMVAEYRAEMIALYENKTIWQEKNVQSFGDYEIFWITVHSSFFAPGHYLLKVLEIDPQKENILNEALFPFEIVHQHKEK